MKNMLNIGCLALLFVLTACPTKESEKVEPKGSDLIGKWEWVRTYCSYRSAGMVEINPNSIKRTHSVEFTKDSLAKFYSGDTLIFQSKVSVIKNLNDYSIKYLAQLNGYYDNLTKYNYYLLGNSFVLEKDSLRFTLNPDCQCIVKK